MERLAGGGFIAQGAMGQPLIEDEVRRLVIVVQDTSRLLGALGSAPESRPGGFLIAGPAQGNALPIIRLIVRNIGQLAFA